MFTITDNLLQIMRITYYTIEISLITKISFSFNEIKKRIFQQDADTQNCGKTFNIDTQFHIQTDG